MTYIHMSFLFANDTIDYCYIDELICNRNKSIVFFNKYHICFPLIDSYNKIISLSERLMPYSLRQNATCCIMIDLKFETAVLTI